MKPTDDVLADFFSVGESIAFSILDGLVIDAGFSGFGDLALLSEILMPISTIIQSQLALT